MVAVLAAALLAGLLMYAVLATPSPNRIEDQAAASAALEPPTTTGPGSPEPSPRGTASTPAVTARPATLPAARSASVPVRLSIPSIEAELSVVPTGVTAERAMEIPDDPRIAGWYRHGPDPTSPTGAVVLAAHIDSKERVGPLARLGQLTPGAEVIVSTEDEEVRYVIERVDSYPKTVIDLDAVFARDGAPRVHIVSCGGQWDAATGAYEDNVVAVAVRVSALS